MEASGRKPWSLGQEGRVESLQEPPLHPRVLVERHFPAPAAFEKRNPAREGYELPRPRALPEHSGAEVRLQTVLGLSH